MTQAATAYEAWDKRWATEDGRADWLAPESFVTDRLDRFRNAGVERVLDLGCGVGRHAVELARQGFAVSALDASPAGLSEARAAAERAGVQVDWQLSKIDPLPYPATQFDLVLSWNVIYHGSGDDTKAAVDEIRRVLRPGGLFLGTFLAKRNARFGEGRLVATDTYVIDGEEEKDHAHFYVDLFGLHRLLGGFQVLDLEQREHRKPGSWHWHVLAEQA
jgi:tellurite methyltransferase